MTGMSATRRGPLQRGAGRRPRRPAPPLRDRSAALGAQAPAAARPPSVHHVVAHELRTPLTSLVVASQILLGNSVSKARRREVVRDVAAEAQRLSDAVEDLLVLAGLEGGGVDPEPVSVQASVRAEIDRASGLVPDLSVRTLLAADVPPVVADGGSVEHLVRNLVAVAVDAAGDRGLVEVVLVREPGSRIRLRAIGRPDRRDAASVAGRSAGPLRDVASRVLAARLGGTFAVAAGSADARAELVLPAGEGAPGDGPVAGDRARD